MNHQPGKDEPFFSADALWYFLAIVLIALAVIMYLSAKNGTL